MSKNNFLEVKTTEYNVDPVFESTSFILFTDPLDIDSPALFYVRENSKEIRYCLINPRKIKDKHDILLKIKRYLMVHEECISESELPNTYFFGDIETAIHVSEDFTNQNVIPVSTEMVNQWYPTTIDQILKIIIRYVTKKQKYPGEVFVLSNLSDDILFIDPILSDSEKRDYKQFLLSCLVQEGLANKVTNNLYIDSFVLTSKAISMLNDSNDKENKIAFIAIKFNNNGKRIEAISNAITKSGFEPLIMSNFETNNWIMPEIFHQIKKSRFVVADFSLPCDGAYYEAGYAAGVDKQVIHLFDKREENANNKLHFDIAQKSTIFYTSEDDLIIRLSNRIKATIK